MAGVGLLVAAVVLVSVAPAAGQESREAGTLTLRPPASLALGDRADLIVVVHVPPRTEEPLLLTPTSVGEAVTVVRGRLLRADAVDTGEDPLTFRVPLVAAELGTAVIRVRVQSFACEERCRSVVLEEEVVVRVERNRQGARQPPS